MDLCALLTLPFSNVLPYISATLSACLVRLVATRTLLRIPVAFLSATSFDDSSELSSPFTVIVSATTLLRIIAMATNTRQNGYAAPASNYKGQQMAYNGQGHGAQYLPRGLPMSPNGDSGLQGLTNTMAALNMQATYGSSGNHKSAGSGMSANSSNYGSLPMTQGQGLCIPNL